jgi:hypothetical protein
MHAHTYPTRLKKNQMLHIIENHVPYYLLLWIDVLRFWVVPQQASRAPHLPQCIPPPSKHQVRNQLQSN